MALRGIRGATTVAGNDRKLILEATTELLARLCEDNSLELDDVAAAFFTTTRDLTATFPALAARLMGWQEVPLMCSHEIDVPGALPLCIRVLVLVNTDKPNREMRHAYLRGAVNLRARVEQELG